MQRNTNSPLGNLRTGDRFYFPDKPAEVWQITGSKVKKPFVAYNRIDKGKNWYLHDRQTTAFAIVRFLRHTENIKTEEVIK